MSDRNPFLYYSLSLGREVMNCSVVDRIEQIKRATDISWLDQVIQHPDIQSSVIKAAKSRIRKLQSAGYQGRHLSRMQSC